jgi:hypothetical protein
MISFGISDPADIAEVDRFGSDVEFPQHDGVQRWSSPRSYAALQGATQEGELERGRGGAWRRKGELLAPCNCVSSSSLGASLYRKKGAPLPLHQARWD